MSNTTSTADNPEGDLPVKAASLFLPTTVHMKRFVICLDGTWNNASREVEKENRKVFRPTNVLKLARATTAFDDNGIVQITYYDAGVGAMNRAPDLRSRILRKADNLLGGGWGSGFEINIEEAYTFLANNYLAGDEIFVFGFSRGAAQARSLCQLIGWAGGFPPKRDAYYVPALFSNYLDQTGQGSALSFVDGVNQRHVATGNPQRISITPAKVKFLGVWDTVLALGWRSRARTGTAEAPYAFHALAMPPDNIETIRHALAIDERRHDFQAEIWEDAPFIEQRWFPGDHSDVGGGANNDALANSSLNWMRVEATAAGLKLDTQFLKYFSVNPLNETKKKSFGYQILDTLLMPVRGYQGVRRLGTSANQTLDDSVFKRLNANKNLDGEPNGRYRPENLLDFLARHPDYDASLDQQVVRELQVRRRL